MAPVLYLNGAAHIKVRTGVIVFSGDRCKGDIYVYPREKRRGTLYTCGILRDLFTYLGKNIVLQRTQSVAGSEHCRLGILKLLSDISLTVRKRLLAYVSVLRDLSHQRTRNFNIISENAIVADTQSLDSGRFAFFFGKFLDPSFAVGHYGTQLVHVLVISVGDHTALTDRGRRRFDDSAVYKRHNIVKSIKRAVNCGKLITFAL